MKTKGMCLLILLIICTFLTAGCTSHGLRDYYYAYGDSISSARDSDYDSTYVMQMRDTYNATATAAHNTDGSGMTSMWGLNNIATHSNAENEFIMFGVNDRGGYHLTGLQTAENLASMYNYLQANGTKPYILINTLVANDTYTGSNTSVQQRDNITIIQNNLSERGIPFVKMYDAIDSIPGNGVPDEIDPDLLGSDGIHPTYDAHTIMATYLWNHLNVPSR
jgi:lysophospholipase L1-like esterase